MHFFLLMIACKLGHEAGITAFIQPGGSIRDKDSIEYCKENNLAMVMTGMRHFRHYPHPGPLQRSRRGNNTQGQLK